MIEISPRQVDFDAVPQAIFWRPLKYFSPEIRHERDDLDEFDFICYTIGNLCNLEVRSYRGHNRHTSTLFLARDRDDQASIDEAIELAIIRLKMPRSAIAWRRGMPFEFGVLDRPPHDRLKEPEARVLTLKIAATKARNSATMALIRSEFPSYFELTDQDKRISVTRRNEPLWHQIVRNVVSHQQGASSPFSQGLATIEGSTISVTDPGLSYLKSIGFLS